MLNHSIVEAGNGDDTIEVASGSLNDIQLSGGQGNDTVVLEGAEEDWQVNDAGESVFYIHQQTGTKVEVLDGVEQVVFQSFTTTEATGS